MEDEPFYHVDAPYFSVVVPTYNRERFISKTLRSIADQVFQDFEVIVVDDCSTDNTVAEVQPFLKDNRFQLLLNSTNSERAVSRNRGMMAAKGKFLTLLDSDDLMYPYCLQDAYDFSKGHPEYKFFRNYYDIKDREGKLLRVQKKVAADYLKLIAKENFLSCIGVFMEREIYARFFFDEDRRIIRSEDWELWLRIMADYKLHTIPKVNSTYTYHSGRSMEKVEPREIEQRKMLVINKTLRNSKVYQAHELDMKVSAMIFVAVQSNEAKMPKSAFAYLAKASRISFIKSMQFRFFVALKNALQNSF